MVDGDNVLADFFIFIDFLDNGRFITVLRPRHSRVEAGCDARQKRGRK